MIPKVIHYCWFGHNELPKSALHCIESWKKYLPDYQIKEWNESNFDVNIIPYVSEAYNARKYAFVSDYARFWILNRYGGLYFDTDVEIIRDLTHIIDNGPFMGCEIDPLHDPCEDRGLGVNPGLGLGLESHNPIIEEIIYEYSLRHFINDDGSYNYKTIVKYTTEKLMEHGLTEIPDIQVVSGITIYPKTYFCPKDYRTGVIHLSDKTVCIHHYGATWQSKNKKIKVWLRRHFGYKFTMLLLKIKKIAK